MDRSAPFLTPCRSGRRLDALAAVIVVALALALPACSLTDDDTRVLVVGDSVTRLSQEEITSQMEWADTVDVRAHDGFRTDELLATARDGVGTDPDIAVVMPGYNDILQDRVDTDALEQMVEIVSEVPCAVWVLIPEEDAGYRTEKARRWNQRVERAVADHDSIHVSTEWDALVSASPDFTFLSDVDAVHPNEQGQRAIAEVMAGTADRECR